MAHDAFSVDVIGRCENLGINKLHYNKQPRSQGTLVAAGHVSRVPTQDAQRVGPQLNFVDIL